MNEEGVRLRPVRWGRVLALSLVYAVVVYLLFRTDEWTEPWFLNLLREMREGHNPLWRRLSSESVWRPLNVLGEFLTWALIVAAVWIMDPRHRRRLIVLAAGTIVACAVAGAAAGLIGRIRPSKSVGKPRKFFAFGEGLKKLRDTSFPSGHATAAAALATFLALSYPRLRGLMIFVAVGCALARVRYAKHFFSDVFVGLLWGHYVMVWAWRLAVPRLAKPPEAAQAAPPEPETPAKPARPPDSMADEIRDALNRRFDEARWEVSVKRLENG